MERRFYLGLGILIALLILGILSAAVMKFLHIPGAEALQTASVLALQGDSEKAITIAQDTKHNWERWRSLTASFADHSPIDDTENLFAEMEVFAAAGENVHFAACCRELSNMLEAMYEAHSFTLWNLL